MPPFLLVSLGFRRFVRHVGNGWRVVHAVRRKAEINPRDEYNFEYSFKSGIHTIRAFSVFFQGVRLQWQLVSDEALNLKAGQRHGAERVEGLCQARQTAA